MEEAEEELMNYTICMRIWVYGKVGLERHVFARQPLSSGDSASKSDHV